jgi:large subunit ribosomal protein L24e
MERKKCSFCGNFIQVGRGKMFVKKDGRILYYCSSKCENNAKLGRIPRRVGWVKKK